MFQVTKTPQWTDSSFKAEDTPQLREYLTDDEYNINLQMREPVFRFLIRHFRFDPKKIEEKDKYPITLIGVKSFALAIELSQWGFPTTLLVRSEQEKSVVIKNMKRHAGTINRILVRDFYRDSLPTSSVYVWFDEDPHLLKDRKVEWIKRLRELCGVLVASVPRSSLIEMIREKIPDVAIVKDWGSYPLMVFS